MSYDFDTPAGLFTLGFNATHFLSYEIPVGQDLNTAGTRTDVVGFFNHNNFARSLPDTKAVLSANLINGPHSVAAYARHVAAYETTRALSATATALGGFDQNIDSFTTLDLQYSYEVQSEDIVITAGIKNAFDEDVPVVFDDANWSYDPKHHDPRGRIFALGIKLSM